MLRSGALRLLCGAIVSCFGSAGTRLSPVEQVSAEFANPDSSLERARARLRARATVDDDDEEQSIFGDGGGDGGGGVGVFVSPELRALAGRALVGREEDEAAESCAGWFGREAR